MPKYTALKVYDGVYHVTDDEDGERVARVALFRTGATVPMVSIDGPRLTSPALARAIAWAMICLADDIDSVR